MIKHDSIRRVSICGRPTAARNFEREVRLTAASAELHPAGLSRAAIVCIRSMRVVPRSIRNGVWQGLETQLPRQIAEAERPALGRVSSRATAIVFSDEAELLSCLARDWNAGDLRRHWWWHSVLRADDLESLAKEAWLGRPRSVPAAIHHLIASQPDLSFLRLFENSEVESLFLNVVDAFGLRSLTAPSTDSLPSRKSKRDNQQTGSSYPRLEGSCLPPVVLSLVDNSQRRFAERRVVAVAAMLIYSPARLRSASFTAEFQQWEQAARQRDEGSASHAESELSNDRSFQEKRHVSRPSKMATNSAPLHFSILTEPDSPSTTSLIFEYVPDKKEDYSNDSAPSDANNLADTEIDSKRTSDPVDSAFAPALVLSEERIDSLSAGLFYLINVALSLGFYSDFTCPQSQGLALPLWDFLELLGERFLGSTMTDDPLKPLWARLSHRRSDEAAGTDFTPPDGLDMKLWLDQTEKQIRDRLENALGVQGETLTTLVFQQRGNVCATATRVDITFILAEHPIELRLAGLDRDPGWVPAGGRTIAFHYE